jgi:hypothetical protein
MHDRPRLRLRPGRGQSNRFQILTGFLGHLELLQKLRTSTVLRNKKISGTKPFEENREVLRGVRRRSTHFCPPALRCVILAGMVTPTPPISRVGGRA